MRLCLLGLLSLVGVAEASAAVPAAVARLPCATREALGTMLMERFGERPIAYGLADNGYLLELFTSAGGDSWTLVSIAPNGRACLVAAGRGWIGRPPTTARAAAQRLSGEGTADRPQLPATPVRSWPPTLSRERRRPPNSQRQMASSIASRRDWG
ncbi:hypothetical protein HRbin40_00929 [bacterium HR40]|nr:hypothetical protein HRbin40_00929 [bacterium HR40]